MGGGDPEGQQKRGFGEEGADQPVTPSDQNAQPDDQDDAEVNQVHGAEPLSPMAPRNSTPPTAPPPPPPPQTGGGETARGGGAPPRRGGGGGPADAAARPR